MNLSIALQKKEASGKPIKIGMIGAGKFGTMFLAQAKITPGMQLVGIAELNIEKARQSCLKTGWSQDDFSLVNSTTAINEGIAKGKVSLVEDAMQLIEADLDVILEITGVPEVGTTMHGWHSNQESM